MSHQPTIDIMRKAFRSNQESAATLASLIRKDAEALKKTIGEPIKIMTFCGTHEWTVTHYGLRSLLPHNVELVPGPGCPVCVTPATHVEQLVSLAMDGVIVYTYGDGLRLPTAKIRRGSICSLQDAKTQGASVRVVYSFLDAVKDARTHRKDSVFFGMGFETITPSYSWLFSKGLVPKNLAFLSTVKLTPPAMRYTIKLYKERGLLPLRGIIAPGHVSTIVGAKEWAFLPSQFGLPTVVSGFEPLDVLLAVAEILRMIRESRPKVVNEYSRLVSWEGNAAAKEANRSTFDEAMTGWRGIGFIPRSGYKLKGEMAKAHDVTSIFGLGDPSAEEYVLTQAVGNSGERDFPPGCRCGEVVIGAAKPTDCPMFMKACTPGRAWGPCMVSAEGTCRVWAMYQGAVPSAEATVASG